MMKVDIDLNTAQFIDEPLAYLTVYHTRIAAYVSPNMMSFIGVIFGALAARFFIKEDLKYRQFGVLLFAVSLTCFDINILMLTQTSARYFCH